LKGYINYPGIKFYTGDFLESRVPGSHGVEYQPYDGVCVECQHYPDSPNHPNFPSTLLKVGSEYNEEILYQFELKPKHESNWNEIGKFLPWHHFISPANSEK